MAEIDRPFGRSGWQFKAGNFVGVPIITDGDLTTQVYPVRGLEPIPALKFIPGFIYSVWPEGQAAIVVVNEDLSYIQSNHDFLIQEKFGDKGAIYFKNRVNPPWLGGDSVLVDLNILRPLSHRKIAKILAESSGILDEAMTKLEALFDSHELDIEAKLVAKFK